MAIQVTSNCELSVRRIIDIGPGARDRVTNRAASTVKLKFTEKSPVPMREHGHFVQALAAGTSTVDLLALPVKHNQPTPQTLGMKVQILKVQNAGASELKVTPATVRGYPLTFTVPPKSFVHVECENTLAPVEANCHLLTLSGGEADTSTWSIVLG